MKDTIKQALEALDESNSLLVAMLHESRPHAEIEEQVALNRAALAALEAEQPAGELKLTDAEIIEWATRHDLKGSIGDLRCIAEDAATIHCCRTTPSAVAAVQPQAVQRELHDLIALCRDQVEANENRQTVIEWGKSAPRLLQALLTIKPATAAAPGQPASKPEVVAWMAEDGDVIADRTKRANDRYPIQNEKQFNIPLTRCATSSKEASEAAQDERTEFNKLHIRTNGLRRYSIWNEIEQTAAWKAWQARAAQAAQPCRDDVLDMAIVAAEGEKVDAEATGSNEDAAYNHGIVDAINAIEALRTQAQPAAPSDSHIARIAYERFHIVADDDEIIAFAKWLRAAPSVPAQAVTLNDFELDREFQLYEPFWIEINSDVRRNILHTARRLLGSAKTGEAG